MPTKTKFIWFGTRQQLAKQSESITPSCEVRDLGIIVDNGLRKLFCSGDGCEKVIRNPYMGSNHHQKFFRRRRSHNTKFQ